MVQEEKKWWYAADKQKFGPYTVNEFKALATSGKIIATHLVWKQGLPKWVPASSIKGLLPQVPTPPPLPIDTERTNASVKVVEDRGHANGEQKEKKQAERNEAEFTSSESWAWNDSRWYLDIIQQYAVFSGRTGRKAYWMFVLYNFIVTFAISSVGHFLDVSLGSGSKLSEGLNIFYNLGIFFPGTAAAVRRMHDVGRSGWWILFPVINVVFLCTKGHAGENKYGHDPKTQDRSYSNREIENIRSKKMDEAFLNARAEFSNMTDSWKNTLESFEKIGSPALAKRLNKPITLPAAVGIVVSLVLVSFIMMPNSVSECGDSDTKDLVKEIVDEALAKRVGELPDRKISYDILGIRTTETCNGQPKPDTRLGSVSIKLPFEFERGLIFQC
ncbi:MAG: DUF805 domain-containing protein [Methylobacter sp.]